MTKKVLIAAVLGAGLLCLTGCTDNKVVEEQNRKISSLAAEVSRQANEIENLKSDLDAEKAQVKIIKEYVLKKAREAIDAKQKSQPSVKPKTGTTGKTSSSGAKSTSKPGLR